MAIDDSVLIDILKEYSDEYNKMTSSEIAKKGDLHPKTVGRRMHELVKFDELFEDTELTDEFEYYLPDGDIIRYSAVKRGEGYILSNFWYEPQCHISNEKLKYLIDSVLYSKVLTKAQAKELVDDIIKLSGRRLSGITSYRADVDKYTYNGKCDVLDYVAKIQGAIINKNKIKFRLNVYSHTDQGVQMISIWREQKIVCPYRVLMSNGRYYLMANPADSDENEYRIYRIDLMDNLEILKNERYKQEIPKELYNISNYILENPYMYAGKTKEVTIKFNAEYFTQIVDWFGDKYTVIKSDTEEDKRLTIKLKVNMDAFSYWVMQYSEHVEVVAPVEFRKKIKQRLEETLKKYK